MKISIQRKLGWSAPNGGGAFELEERNSAVLSFCCCCFSPCDGIRNGNRSRTESRSGGTTDLLACNAYDYLTVKGVDYGFARPFTLIKWAREMYNNTILIDTGDAIRGSVLAEREANESVKMEYSPSIIKAMNIMNYDVVGIGNADSFGLEYLDLAVAPLTSR